MDVDVVALSTRQKKEEKILWLRPKKRVRHPQTKTKGERKMKNKLLSFGILLALTITAISPANAISLASLRNSLSKVCISDRATCGTVFEGIYNTSNNSCSCHNTTYQQYDSNQRKCVMKCGPGYYMNSVSGCPRGSYRIQIKRRRLYSYERG